ncbi:TetR/AcrR family transcriptional regulator [uncultured Pseudokineococcus sp.]|uniref:TetR/AcrR family transcriptional regulator n=1 Tax=uncultured Pseudokineococcus sp. TaxID=1642928 RepID=UPI00262868A2|nr:TetR/AcrR family transcriptional regulator [uncultured Pseudokineococcus sp.]
MEEGTEQAGSREKVLAAAAAMYAEDPTATLSVRAVAARAGVSTGSLRFHFPTQAALRETLLAAIYDHSFPDDVITDVSRPPRERLLTCLRNLLAPVGTGPQAREAWRRLLKQLLAAEPPTAQVQAAYEEMGTQSSRRVARWLRVLADEGALPPGNNEVRAHFLLTVVGGLSFERATPGAEGGLLAREALTLGLAVNAVFGRSSDEAADGSPTQR